MNNLRKHGKAPFTIAVIHSGPGAGGEMAPVARELCSNCGILEPIQTADSVEGQVEELKSILDDNATLPVTLIGYSWGAWLSFILAARYPAIVKKLILVSAGPFTEKYTTQLQQTRLDRLTDKKKTEFNSAIKILDSNESQVMTNKAFKALGRLSSITDSYNPIDNQKDQSDTIITNAEIFKKVWPQAAKLRSTGKLLELAEKIKCPTIAIHGDYDPHPYQGVKEPLTEKIEDFKIILLKNCGHKPWIERDAKEEFYKILKDQL